MAGNAEATPMAMPVSVQKWLEGLDLGQYAEEMRKQGYDDFRILRMVDDAEVAELTEHLKMSAQHASQLRRAWGCLRDQNAGLPGENTMDTPDVKVLLEAEAQLLGPPQAPPDSCCIRFPFFGWLK
eukprot:TRINITY_DN122795_c0_g1_i1.p2 TRINITY_DN122795_c0_g1~~TRINITY_DN122795_c0_g1_i1.p2  ORF type:complete len:126 (+),score=28.93 TRINITY_DN122795_c0_g1_i1:216-593(+)